MKRKKIMRGYWWYLFLFIAFLTFVTSVIGLCGGDLGLDSILANIIALIISGLYIIAFFILPKHIKLPEMSAVPTENAPLAAPAQITIVRESSVVGAAMPTIVFLNGEQVCALKNGCSDTILLTMKQNVLMTNSVGSSKVRYAFEAADGARGVIHVKGGVFLPKTMRWQ